MDKGSEIINPFYLRTIVSGLGELKIYGERLGISTISIEEDGTFEITGKVENPERLDDISVILSLADDGVRHGFDEYYHLSESAKEVYDEIKDKGVEVEFEV